MDINRTFKYFYANIYFLGTIIVNLLIVVSIYGHNLYLKFLQWSLVYFISLVIYLPTFMAASVSKSGHQFYDKLNSIICHCDLEVGLKLKASIGLS